MKTINVATLKQQLSAYLHLVEEGNEVVITSHHRPVARLIREAAAEGEVVCRPPSRAVAELKKVLGIELPGKNIGVETLLDDRSSR